MQAIAVIAAVVALVWGAVLLGRGGLLAGCLAVMLAGTCLSAPVVKLDLGPLPLTIDRLLIVVLLVQYVLWRRFGWADPKPLGKPEVVALALVGVLALRTFTTDYRAFGSQPVAWLGIYYVMPLAIYWVVRQARLERRGVLAVLGAMTAFGLYLAITTIAERYQLWGLVLPRYIVTSAATEGAEFVGRGRGPVLNPIGNGILLAACLAATLTWWPRLGRPGRLALLGLVLLLLAALYCTMTRSVWLGGVAVLLIAAGLTLTNQWRVPLLLGTLVVAALLAATEWDNIVRFKRDRELSAADTAESVRLRPILAQVAWQMFLDRPLLGCGYGQYRREHLDYTNDRSADVPLTKARGYVPHNVFLSLLAETGLIGAGLFVVLLGLWGRDAWRLWRQGNAPLWARQQGFVLLALLAVYVINGMFHDVSIIAMANMTLFFAAGVAAGLRPLAGPAPAVAGQPAGRPLPGAAGLHARLP
jgi:O-antigen ligase